MKRRDHTQLICNIGELSGLFSDATSLETFLQSIVEMIADHMRCPVCSIYLFYEDSHELVLKATKGLKLEAIGKVRLKLGEGLTGLAVQELRPICDMNASGNPAYRYFPDIGEEAYESFLAVPILRGANRIGAMVIQNSKKNYFNEDDIQAFRAITSQLANTIETAKLLMSLNENRFPSSEVSVAKELRFIKGRVGSEGYARAEGVVLDTEMWFDYPAEPAAHGDGKIFGNKKYSLEDFLRAVQMTEKELETLQQQIEEKLSDVASLIFTAQILMLKDNAFIEGITRHIERGVNPPIAIIRIVEEYVKKFQALSNEYLREKWHDVRDIGRRLLMNLTGMAEIKDDFHNRIVIARELFPSDILKLSSQGIKGIILLSGGITSHLAILARSLEMPLVIADNQQLLRIAPRTQIILDAEQGNIYINPTDEILNSFHQREQHRLKMHEMQKAMNDVTKTKDGTRVQLLANINLLGDTKLANAVKAEGVGLYRTEFPFIVRSDFPSEEEQYIIYKKLIQSMPGKEMTFRTLDIGGDKVLSYYDYGKEENPFLGMRSIRFSLRHRDIFRQQLRAILRAGEEANLRIMFPMISSMDEFLEARQEAQNCIKDLLNADISCHTHPLIGMMIELPAVLEIIEDLAQEADFFSIGTNDFIQYMLAVDRTNEKVADLYLPHHPAILRSLKRIVDVADTHQKEVSICGDMAHNERYIPYLLGIGIRKLSLDPHCLPKIQKAIERINIEEVKSNTARLIKQNRIVTIDKMLNDNKGNSYA